MTPNPFPPGTKVIVSEHAHPNGPGIVVSSDEWTCCVKLDGDRITYMFGNSVVTKSENE